MVISIDFLYLFMIKFNAALIFFSKNKNLLK